MPYFYGTNAYLSLKLTKLLKAGKTVTLYCFLIRKKGYVAYFKCCYLIRILLNFSMFLITITFPATTSHNRFSAIYTGKSVIVEILLSKPLNIDPPPAK